MQKCIRSLRNSSLESSRLGPSSFHLFNLFNAFNLFNPNKPLGWRLLGLAALAFSFSSVRPALAGSAEVPANLRPAVDAAVARVKPALVRILVVSTSYSDGREIKSQAVGSGAIITREGHVISNHHVAGRAVRIFCTLADREEIEAELIGSDPLTDICIIQLKPAKRRQFVAA